MATQTKEQKSHGSSTEQLLQEQGSKINLLNEYGGFAFLENVIDGLSNLNPTRKARKNIFLNDAQWENERTTLTNRLELWLDLLKGNDSVESMIEVANTKATSADSTLNRNLKYALNVSRELETSYRSVALFYKNAESDKIKNVTIVNADISQLNDLYNTLFIYYVSN